MQRASRESLVQVREQQAAAIDAVDDAGLRQLADDLRSVARLLVRQPGLRRALSDPASELAARTGLLDSLLSGRISALALDAVRTLVSVRWSRPTDFVDAAEQIGIDAILALAERHGELAEVEDELFRFSRIVADNSQLAASIDDATGDPDRRANLATDLLAGKTTETTVRLVDLAVRSGVGGRRVEPSLRRLVELVAARRDREVAYVRAASPLTAEQEERLSRQLSATYGRDISLRIEVDPAILGGLTVRIGDEEYDGSVSRRLANARSALGK